MATKLKIDPGIFLAWMTQAKLKLEADGEYELQFDPDITLENLRTELHNEVTNPKLHDPTLDDTEMLIYDICENDLKTFFTHHKEFYYAYSMHLWHACYNDTDTLFLELFLKFGSKP